MLGLQMVAKHARLLVRTAVFSDLLRVSELSEMCELVMPERGYSPGHTVYTIQHHHTSTAEAVVRTWSR